MTNAPSSLQDLRKNLYDKAKAESIWRFWGLYVHVCKQETLQEAYEMAKKNNGAPGVDGVTFEAIEESGVESFLKQIRNELTTQTYRPMPVRKKEIPKDGGTKVRVLSIPSIRDRVVQGALKLILEPIFEADFQPGSYGYRPQRTAHEAINRVAQGIVEQKTKIIEEDFDTATRRLYSAISGQGHYSYITADFTGVLVIKRNFRVKDGFGNGWGHLGMSRFLLVLKAVSNVVPVEIAPVVLTPQPVPDF